MQRHNQVEEIRIDLGHLRPGLSLQFFPEGNSQCFILPSNIAEEWNESPYQILEGNSYEFEFEGGHQLTLESSIKSIVTPSKKYAYRGRITPNIYVGRLQLRVIDTSFKEAVGQVELEVLATKFNQNIDESYRTNYRKMLEDITEKCTDILMQVNAPVVQSFAVDFNKSSQTIYQRFSFISSIINTTDFENAVLQIQRNPATGWIATSDRIPTQNVKRATRGVVKQLTRGANRITVDSHFLEAIGFDSLPQKIDSTRKTETFDTPENRFIKHALEEFLRFASTCEALFSKRELTHPAKEAKTLINKLSGMLNQPFFKEIQQPTTLKINSPVLQKRSGYRELLNRWLQFDLAAQLIWKGGEDVYNAGKKDIATLYEYWLFFVLYDLVKDKFGYSETSTIDKPFGKIIELQNEGLNLTLKAGNHIVIQGNCNRYTRNLNYRFSYNRSFKGNTTYTSQRSGSWTATLRPDYTLSFWPAVFTEKEAEKQDAIVHVHFDAKYKIEDFTYQIAVASSPSIESEDADENSEHIIDEKLRTALNEQKEDERKGRFKNIDLLKMHAYKDAIRRTGGAYVLYPGKKKDIFNGFHEIIPGLGAFSINPSHTHSGVAELSAFLDEVIDHILDRATQRERINNQSNQILSEDRSDYKSSTFRYPESFDRNKIDPKKCKVLIAYYKPATWDWIQKNSLINLRTETNRGSLKIQDYDYLLLHTTGELITDKFYKITGAGPRIFSKQTLIDKGYPGIPSQEFYLVYSFEEIEEPEFRKLRIDIRKLQGFSGGRKSAIPFGCLLEELVSVNLHN